MKSLYGSIRWNIVFGLIGFVVSTLVSLTSNLWGTSLLRGLLAFVIWFLLAYGIRFVVQELQTPGGKQINSNDIEEDSNVGMSVNMSTPDDTASLYNMLHSQPNEDESNHEQRNEVDIKEGQGDFTPLTPPKLVSKPMNDEQMAQAVRHLTQQ